MIGGDMAVSLGERLLKTGFILIDCRSLKGLNPRPVLAHKDEEPID
jgi:hypothetical protein